jgi:hypothetical protein
MENFCIAFAIAFCITALMFHGFGWVKQPKAQTKEMSILDTEKW